MTTPSYWVYILASQRNGTLYTGVTNRLERRLFQHRQSTSGSFTAGYAVHHLVYFEQFRDVNNVIAREKRIKGGSRQKKITLIEKDNPEWKDLAAGWFG